MFSKATKFSLIAQIVIGSNVIFLAPLLIYGLLLSLFAVGFTGFTGWHGGKLVFEYQIGVSSTGS